MHTETEKKRKTPDRAASTCLLEGLVGLWLYACAAVPRRVITLPQQPTSERLICWPPYGRTLERKTPETRQLKLSASTPTGTLHMLDIIPAQAITWGKREVVCGI